MPGWGAEEMSEKIRVMRSQLGRVRGTGAARSGVEHWWVERITAAALVPLTLWFVISVLAMLGADQPSVAAWVAHPLHATLLIALVLLTFHHAQLGLQVVYEDYISVTLRTVAILATKAVAALLALIGVLAVLKLYLTAH
jgi:succinate dehydrogenase / fumarate reductase membrane anchor subunit